jgi:hypothetical protein
MRAMSADALFENGHATLRQRLDDYCKAVKMEERGMSTYKDLYERYITTRLERDHYELIIKRLYRDIKPLMDCLRVDCGKADEWSTDAKEMKAITARCKLFGTLDMFNLQASALPNANQIKVAAFVASRINAGDKPDEVAERAVGMLEQPEPIQSGKPLEIRVAHLEQRMVVVENDITTLGLKFEALEKFTLNLGARMRNLALLVADVARGQGAGRDPNKKTPTKKD